MLSSIIFTCHPFQPSSISLLRVGNTFSISFPFDVTITKKLSWCLTDWTLSISNVNGDAYSYPLPPLWWWGLNLDLNDIERVIIHLSVPKKTMVSTLLSVNTFTDCPSLMGARGAHKRHQGYNYSYHRVQNLNNPDSTLMLIFYYFYMSPLSNPSPYHC